MISRPIAYVQSHFAEVLESVRSGRTPVLVTQNGASAVVIEDHVSYERKRNALALLRLVADGEEELARGRGISHGKLIADLRARLRRRKK